MAEKATAWVFGADDETSAASIKKPARRPVKERTFVSALRAKYCTVHDIQTKGVEIVFHAKPKSADDDAELSYLRNVVLCDSRIKRSGLENFHLHSLCPNVVDLDLSGNLFDCWSDVLPILSQMTNITFLNLARNKINNKQDCLQSWSGSLPAIENLVLNETGMKWQDVLFIARLLPHLKELHICGNGYSEIPEDDHNGLESVECLRLNNNCIQSWKEVWKLRHLSRLNHMILSGNPLLDVFFHDNDLDLKCQCNNGGTRSEGQQDIEHMVGQLEDSSGIKQTDIINNDKNVTADTSIDNPTEENNTHIKPEEHNIDNKTEGHNTDKPSEETNTEIPSEEQYKDSPTEEQNINSKTEGHNSHKPNEELNTDGPTEDKTIDKQMEDHNTDIKSTDKAQCNTCGVTNKPFDGLETLCLSETKIGKWKHLTELSKFPALKAIRLKDIKLGSNLSQEDKRKLFMASLPNIQHLNASEVTLSEREKAERHLVRYFSDKPQKPAVYKKLEQRHGTLTPLVDIDISKGYQEMVALTFVCDNVQVFIQKFNAREPVSVLRTAICDKMNLHPSKKNGIKLQHHFTGPQQSPDDDGSLKIEPLVQGNLPLSRFDIMDGDEIHVTLPHVGNHMKTVTFTMKEEVILRYKVDDRQPTSILYMVVAEALNMFNCMKSISLYHKFCGPSHGPPGEGGPKKEFIIFDHKPVHTNNIKDGDEIDIELNNRFHLGLLPYVNIQSYMPPEMGHPDMRGDLEEFTGELSLTHASYGSMRNEDRWKP